MTLASWIPPYLHRLGMEFNWSVKLGRAGVAVPGLKFAVTAYYGADVDAHRAAYLTGGAGGVRVRRAGRHRGRVAEAAAARLAAGRSACRRCSCSRSSVFAAALAWVVYERPVGAAIAGRVRRAGAGRVDREPGVAVAPSSGSTGSSSRTRRPSTSGSGSRRPTYPILVPIRPGRRTLLEKEIEVRTRHRIPGTVPVMFVSRGAGRPERLPPPAADADRPRERPGGDPHHAVLLDPARAGGGRAGDRVRRRACRRSTSGGRRRTR